MHNMPQITIYSPRFERIAPLNYFESMKLVSRFDELSTLEVKVTGTHDRIGALMTPGCRLVVHYGGRQVFSGPVRKVAGAGPSSESSVTVTAEDDIRLLWRMLLWPSTTSPGGENGVTLDREYRYITGPAETVTKTLIAENIRHLEIPPITVAADKGRGPKVSTSVRFHTFADRVLPLIGAAGMRVTVFQSSQSLLVDCVPTRTIPRVFSEASGAITSWEFARTGPTATSVVVGGSGEGKDRRFTVAGRPSLEREWQDAIEVFVDARNGDSEKVTLRQEAQQKLDESQPVSGFKITLSDRMIQNTIPDDISPGDTITVNIAGVDVSERIKEIEYVCEDPGSGWTSVTPIAGEYQDDPSRMLASKLAAMATNIRNTGTL